MKGAVILLVFMAAYAAQGSPLLGIDLGLNVDLSLGGIWSGLKNLISNTLSSLGESLSLAGNAVAKGEFLDFLKGAIQAKVEAAGEITAEQLSPVLLNTLKLAVGNKLVSEQIVARIYATFEFKPIITGAQVLTAADIDGLTILGNADTAAKFRLTLKNLLEAKNNGASQLQLLAGVQLAVTDLCVGNAVMKAKGALDLNNYFNLTAIAGSVHSAVSGAVGSVVEVLSKLQGRIAGDVQAAQDFIAKTQVAVEAKVSAAGQVSLSLLAKVVSNVLDLATKNGVLTADASLRLVATFAPELGSNAIPLTVADIDALVIGGNVAAAAQFKATLKALLQLKANGGTSFVCLGSLQAAVLDLLAANAVIKAQGYLDVKASLSSFNSLLLTPILELVNATNQLIGKLSGQVAGSASAASDFMVSIKAAAQAKLAAGGQLTIGVVQKVVGAVLKLASGNGVLKLDAAASLGASFGINIGVADAKPLTVADVDGLAIGGDANAAAQFKATLKSLLQITADKGVSITALAGLDVALVDLLASNGIIIGSAALGLKAFFVA